MWPELWPLPWMGCEQLKGIAVFAAILNCVVARKPGDPGAARVGLVWRAEVRFADFADFAVFVAGGLAGVMVCASEL
ncbi:MAG: hypothetical protein ACXWQ5_02015 [Ktedonobacterales bacterium]